MSRDIGKQAYFILFKVGYVYIMYVNRTHAITKMFDFFSFYTDGCWYASYAQKCNL